MPNAAKTEAIRNTVHRYIELVAKGSADDLIELYADDATVDVQAWAAGDPGDHAARNLAERARAALAAAWRTQTVAAGGSIARFAEQSASALLVDDTVPHGVYRYQATYDLLVRTHRP